MKKVFFAIAASLMMLAAMTSCGVDKNDPLSVADAAAKCIKNQDIEGYFELSDAKPEEQQQLAALVKDKVVKEHERKGGIKSYEIGEADINEERGTAHVQVKLVYGNGEESNDPIRLKRDDNGDWKVVAGK
jgi:hypothetical protein